jgi:hypothetical protein
MSEIKIYDCHNTNTINNTRKYVAYEDFIAYKEKAEAEVERLKTITEVTLKHFTELKQRILQEIDKDGFARLIVHESMMKDIDFVIDTIKEKDGEG